RKSEIVESGIAVAAVSMDRQAAVGAAERRGAAGKVRALISVAHRIYGEREAEWIGIARKHAVLRARADRAAFAQTANCIADCQICQKSPQCLPVARMQRHIACLPLSLKGLAFLIWICRGADGDVFYEYDLAQKACLTALIRQRVTRPVIFLVCRNRPF